MAAGDNHKPCPSCGHCPTCGRGGVRVAPRYPYHYPYVPYSPYPWYPNTVYSTGTSGTPIQRAFDGTS